MTWYDFPIGLAMGMIVASALNAELLASAISSALLITIVHIIDKKTKPKEVKQ